MYFKYLTKERVLRIHENILKRGGTEGLLSDGMLELALEIPSGTFFGTELHVSLFRKAAAFMHEIIKLSPFVDGNKRTAFTATDVLLRMNGRELESSEQKAIDICLKTSQCSIDICGLAGWIESNSRRRHAR